MLKIYNTLTRSKEEFKPITESEVKMYGCGVTPYKPSHLGHGMQGVFFDLLRRYFEYKGYKVTYVRNYTDVDDKIINAALSAGENALKYSETMIKIIDEDFERLRVRTPDFAPKVSENIDGIIALTEELIQKGKAYATEKGNVYFKVDSFKDYGKLSNQKLDQLRHGSRKDLEEDKTDPVDFALWKSAKPGEIFWNSPWGKGRPGWHIECSVMSMKHLGEHFDIHGGGADLMFPHHENEIAQSESIHNGKFANYWVHNGLLMMGENKMSKSLGNDISIGEWLEIYHPQVIIYMILTNHYRSNIQFVPERYTESSQKVYEIYKTLLRAHKSKTDDAIDKEKLNQLTNEFEEYMDDDFNIVKVVALVHTLINRINTLLDDESSQISEINTIIAFIKNISGVINLFDLDPESTIKEMEDLFLKANKISREKIDEMIKNRTEAKENKDYEKSDKIRDKLLKIGINVKDKENKTEWEIKFK